MPKTAEMSVVLGTNSAVLPNNSGISAELDRRISYAVFFIPPFFRRFNMAEKQQNNFTKPIMSSGYYRRYSVVLLN